MRSVSSPTAELCRDPGCAEHLCAQPVPEPVTGKVPWWSPGELSWEPGPHQPAQAALPSPGSTCQQSWCFGLCWLLVDGAGMLRMEGIVQWAIPAKALCPAWEAPSTQPCPLSTCCLWLSFLWQKIHILIPSLLPLAVAAPSHHFSSPPACGLEGPREPWRRRCCESIVPKESWELQELLLLLLQGAHKVNVGPLFQLGGEKLQLELGEQPLLLGKGGGG